MNETKGEDSKTNIKTPCGYTLEDVRSATFSLYPENKSCNISCIKVPIHENCFECNRLTNNTFNISTVKSGWYNSFIN